MESGLAYLDSVDVWARTLLVPLAVWILISGLDDLVVDSICLFTWLSQRALHRSADWADDEQAALSAPPKRIAILVPCWREDGVIRQMIESNLLRLEYPTYDFFVGVYPNDQPTMAAVRELETRFARVHMALCGRPGPTSKADCLNWIYQRMLAFERRRNDHFDVVVTHDAEDIIHRHELHWINYHTDLYDMVQAPVLPLATPWSQWTHGIYCDEFAESQLKDMPGRQILRGFLPSSGVGAGYTRWALDQLDAGRGCIFEPSCLTEDYENGLKLHFLGCPQLFMKMHFDAGEPVATREFFPQTRQAAIRQRTRWVTGIALQSWERHGWRGGWGARYWLWRDRKGLIGNPVSMLTTLLFLYGCLSWLSSLLSGRPWAFGVNHSIPALALLGSTATLQCLHLAVRAWCVSFVYGWRFATGVPLRALYANYINCLATLAALARYALARFSGRPLPWLKTDHCYPVPATLSERPKLGEILVAAGRIPPEQLQSHIPFSRIDSQRVRRNLARALPAHVVAQWRVLPFQATGGFLFLASPELPGERFSELLAAYTKLTVRILLVTESNFNALRAEFL
ncbi:MAG: glycosyl transferase family protein [Acidobacteria bacterium]|nr:glycosyl transferase family protein [Acidobacteriota bacterium]